MSVTAFLRDRAASLLGLGLGLVFTAFLLFSLGLGPSAVGFLCAVFALCLLGFFLGYQAARLLKADFPTAVTMSLNSGIRNIAAGSVLAIAYFPGDVLFPVAFSPLFLQATTAVIVKILHATKAGKAFLQQGELSK